MGKILILSDIHGNLPALDAVLGHAGKYDAIWCCGDIVGYGPSPSQCVRRIREAGSLAVAGNHDAAAVGAIDTSRFNKNARAAVEWTSRHLDVNSADYLLSLPYKIRNYRPEISNYPTDCSEVRFHLVHGSPQDPLSDYLVSSVKAWYAFKIIDEQVCINGHSHHPWIYRQTGEEIEEMSIRNKDEFQLEEGCRYILNVGSVGQPRDGDPRACYFTFEPEHRLFTCHRVRYPVEQTQEMMRKSGLPEFLIGRLEDGY